VTTNSASTPARHPLHVVMVVDNDVVIDSRVRKEATSLADAGYRVTVVGLAGAGLPSEERVGDALILRIEVPRHILEEKWDQRVRRRQRRLPLVGYRSRSAYDAARLRIEARRRDVEAAAGRTLAMYEAGEFTHLAFRFAALGRRLRQLALGVREIVVRGRGVMRHRMNRAAKCLWSSWDGLVAQRGIAARWRRVTPGMDDFEIAYGAVIDQLEPDVVHAQDVFSIGLAARAAARARLAGRGVPLVYDAHEFVPGLARHAGRSPRYAAAIESLEREYIGEAALILTVGPAVAQAITAHYGLERPPTVVLNTPAMGAAARGGPTIRDAAGLDEATPLLVYSGGLKRVRGVDVTIRALGHLPRVHLAVVCIPDTRTPLVGELREQADEQGVADRVHFVDPVPSDDVVSFLRSADVGVQPMLGGVVNHELALPNKLFEYLHAGLPMVVTDLQELGKFVREHGLGETFSSGNPVDLAASAQKVLANPHPYRRAASDSALLAEYSWDHQAQALIAAYDTLRRS
jgi:glycosyltransferase involved in cell wall biosynthesis